MIKSNRVGGATAPCQTSEILPAVIAAATNDNCAAASIQKHRIAPGQSSVKFAVSERFFRQPMGGPGYVGYATVEIVGRQVKISRKLRAGMPITVKLRANQFIGVAMRAEAVGGGVTDVHLELLHTDPLLSIPLLISQSDSFLASDWRAWADQLCLPMVIVEGNESKTFLSEKCGDLTVCPTLQRRKRASWGSRRPRFLARRRTGVQSPNVALTGREIIARH